jgi:hypothetical protein
LDACQAAHAPNRRAVEEQRAVDVQEVRAALQEGEEIAAEAALLDPGWAALQGALHDWALGLFEQSIGGDWPAEAAQPVLRTVTLECERAGYRYGSP